MIKKVIKKILHKNTYSSEAYTRYLQSKGVTVGEGTHFFAPHTNSIDVGRGSYIKIGKYCCITQGVQILAHDYSWTVLIHSHREILPDPGKPVEIGDHVFLGWNVIVMGGVKIGSNVIIGANSVITKDIPDNCVYAGNPARYICSLDDYYEKRRKAAKDAALARMQHVLDTKKRPPTEAEMGWFSVLWLDRTEENAAYLRTLPAKGVQMEEAISVFMETEKSFDSFADFLKQQ